MKNWVEVKFALNTLTMYKYYIFIVGAEFKEIGNNKGEKFA